MPSRLTGGDPTPVLSGYGAHVRMAAAFPRHVYTNMDHHRPMLEYNHEPVNTRNSPLGDDRRYPAVMLDHEANRWVWPSYEK